MWIEKIQKKVEKISTNGNELKNVIGHSKIIPSLLNKVLKLFNKILIPKNAISSFGGMF